MAEKSGFFNARFIDGEYDRRYSADDYCDNLAVVISNGVLRSTGDDLKVTASGMYLTVAPGRAWIKGHYYLNTAPLTLAGVSAPIGGSRYDRVILRLDTSLPERKISLKYVEGIAGNTPQKPALVRNDTIYDLCLADILVAANATVLMVMDSRADSDVCGWVYSTSGDNSFFTSLDGAFYEWFEGAKDTLSSVTLFKRYSWSGTLSAASRTVQFVIPQYDADTSFIEVYVNGILDTRYTVTGNVLTFAGTLTAGTTVTVNCYKSIDGTGIMSVSDEITELQNRVDALDGASRFVYRCTGLNDNIILSQIAQAFISKSYDSTISTAAKTFLDTLGGNTYLSALTTEAQVTIEVVGRTAITTPFGGSGTTASRYRYFALGEAGTNARKLIFDFSKCEKITIGCGANTNNIIFYGTDLNIKGANVYAYSNGNGCNISMIAGSSNNGIMNFDDCRFSVSTSGTGVISENGTFTGCHCTVKSTAGDALCFDAKTESLVRLIGGTYYAYINSSGVSRAAVMNISTTETDAVIMAHNINCPTVSVSGYMQRHLAIGGAGSVYINGVVSTMTTSGTTVTVSGQIWKSKR